jgi:hypothetical protein
VLNRTPGQFIVQLQAKPIATIALGGRLLRDLVNQINADFRDELVATSDYSLYRVSLVGDLPAGSVAPGQTMELYADSDEPDLRIGFGAVLALAEPKADGAGGRASHRCWVSARHRRLAPDRWGVSEASR